MKANREKPRTFVIAIKTETRTIYKYLAVDERELGNLEIMSELAREAFLLKVAAMFRTPSKYEIAMICAVDDVVRDKLLGVQRRETYEDHQEMQGSLGDLYPRHWFFRKMHAMENELPDDLRRCSLGSVPSQVKT